MAAFRSRTPFLVLFLVALSGCAGVPVPVTSCRLPAPPRGIVLVVDGAGGYQLSPRSVVAAVEEAGLPLYVRSFDWTHGRGRGLADMTDVPHAREQGCQLAAQVSRYRATYPGVPVYLVSHSAGSSVALAAAEALAPDSVERIVMLAPAVAADYDLRRALLAARQGIDVFSSERDRFWLGFGTALVGTADGKRGVDAAGRVGFCPPSVSPCEQALAGRLRQHPWDSSVAWTGNFGDHAGTLRVAYLRAYVLPLLRPAAQ